MTIAVIGHGRSPEGKGWGKRIDACSAVIRMWDWDWQEPKDYGKKYTHGLFVLTSKGLAAFTNNNKHTPSKGWLAYNGKLADGCLPNGTELITARRWVKLGKFFGGVGLTGELTLTRGTVAACWAIENCERRDGNVVVLVGFDNVFQGINLPVTEAFPPKYWEEYCQHWAGKMEAYPENEPQTATHDMRIEAPLLRTLAERNNVALQFAQEYWA